MSGLIRNVRMVDLRDSSGKHYVATADSHLLLAEAYGEPNAKRIAALWNACIGMSTEQIEALSHEQSLPELIHTLQRRLIAANEVLEARQNEVIRLLELVAEAGPLVAQSTDAGAKLAWMKKVKAS